MMDLRELAGLDFQGARELLFAYMTDMKRHDKDISAAAAEMDLWKSRIALAESRGMAELAAAARAKAAELSAKIAGMAATRAEIEGDVRRIRDALPGIRAKERSIDPDRLLAELQMMTGELLDPEGAKLERELAALGTGSAKPQSAAAASSAPPADGPASDRTASPDAAPAKASPEEAAGNPSENAAPGDNAAEGQTGTAQSPAPEFEDALAALKRKMGMGGGKSA